MTPTFFQVIISSPRKANAQPERTELLSDLVRDFTENIKDVYLSFELLGAQNPSPSWSLSFEGPTASTSDCLMSANSGDDFLVQPHAGFVPYCRVQFAMFATNVSIAVFVCVAFRRPARSGLTSSKICRSCSPSICCDHWKQAEIVADFFFRRSAPLASLLKQAIEANSSGLTRDIFS